MGNIRKIVVFSGVFILLLSLANLNAQTVQTKTTQTGTKSKQVNSKTKQSSKSAQKGAKTVKPEPKAEPAKKVRDPAVITIGLQNWALANLNVGAFRNGDTIPEAKSNKEWVSAGDAGKPAWCYYNNDLAIGKNMGNCTTGMQLMTQEDLPLMAGPLPVMRTGQSWLIIWEDTEV